MEKKQNAISEYGNLVLLKQRNRDDARKCIDAIIQSCAKNEEDAYSFVKSQIEAEIQDILDNIDKWVDEVFDSSSIVSWIYDDELPKKINSIQNRCSTRIQKAIEQRIVPYINTSTNSLNNNINHLVEKYIIAVNIDNNNINTSVSLNLAVKESPLTSNMEPLPIMATLMMLKESSIMITTLAFNPICGMLAALGIGLGLGFLKKERKKKKIISCIKEQLKSYSLTLQYVQAIMDAVRWKEDTNKTISALKDIITEYNADLAQLSSDKTKLIAEIGIISELEKRRYDIFNSMDMQLSRT